MDKRKKITKSCPLCKYTYQEEVIVDKSDFSPTFDTIAERTVTNGDKDFIPLLTFGGRGTQTLGMFCPKCGILLNDKICTSEEILEP